MKTGTNRHKWNLITDQCIKCGIYRRNSRLVLCGGYSLSKPAKEYSFDQIRWDTKLPDCIPA